MLFRKKPFLSPMIRTGLGVLVCLVLAGVVDEWTLRGHRPEPGDSSGCTVARVVAFDEPALEIHAGSVEPHSKRFFRSQVAVIQPYFGSHAGELLAARNLLGPNPSSSLVLRRGAVLKVSIDDSLPQTDVKLLQPPLRYRWALLAAMIVAATVIVAAGRVGMRALAVMTGSGLLMIMVLVPLLAKGYPPVAVTGAFCVVMLAAVFAISGRIDRKAFAAAGGTAAGLAVAAAVILASAWYLHFNGTDSVSGRFLAWTAGRRNIDYDYSGLLVASMLVAFFGLVMDTAMTIATGVAQVNAARPGLSRGDVFDAGMNISRDIVGTMVLTLVFAFVGLRLPVMLLPAALGVSPAEMVNSEAGASEILHVIAGAIALTATGPVTATIASIVALWKPESRPAKRETAANVEQPFQAADLLHWQAESLPHVWPKAAAIVAVIVIATGAGAWWRLRSERLAACTIPSLDGDVASLLADAAGNLCKGKTGPALLALWAARDRDPARTDVRTDLAYAYMSERWIVQARREVQAALAAGADDAKTHYVAGVVWIWADKVDLAARHLRRAAELAPDNTAIRDALEQLVGQ